jgi:hypothetical protein
MGIVDIDNSRHGRCSSGGYGMTDILIERFKPDKADAFQACGYSLVGV